MLFSEISQYIFMGIFVGLMYLQLSNSVETGVQDRLASIWFAMAVLSFSELMPLPGSRLHICNVHLKSHRKLSV